MNSYKTYKLSLLAIAIMLIASACTTVGKESLNLGGGDTADVVWKTSAFGTDGMGIRFKSKAPNDLDILRLESYESHQSTTQTYDQRCPDPRQLKNIKTTTVNQQRTAYQDVPNPNKRQDQTVVVGGTNPSVGNVLLPAAAMGAGIAFSGGTTNMIQGGASAVVKGVSATGGKGGKGGNSTNTNVNVNPNTNVNNVNATSGSSSSSSSAAGAAATSN